MLDRLAKLSPGNVWLAAASTFKGTDRARLNRLAAMASQVGVPLLAVNDVLYHEPNRKIMQDVVNNRLPIQDQYLKFVGGIFFGRVFSPESPKPIICEAPCLGYSFNRHEEAPTARVAHSDWSARTPCPL